jgi:hypothetical protein
MEDLKNQIINKAGFLLYTDYWNKYFSKMTAEQVKEAFNIIFHFNTTFEVLKTNDLAVEMVIATIIDNIKRDASKRAKQSIASAENGKLGGRPKKPKKVKPNSEIIPAKDDLPIFINKDLFNAFVEMRIKIKKQLTEKARELLIKNLIKFETKQKGFANEALENSIQNSYQGVFEPRQNGYNNNQNKTQGVSEWKRIIS